MSLDYFKKYNKETVQNKVNNNVWVYTRVSSKDQKANSSLVNQISSAKEYAKENNYHIEKTFGETFESASGDFTRKEFSKLISEVKTAKNKPYAIMIYKMNRFSRTGGNAIGLVSELIRIHNVHLIEISSKKDTTTDRGELEIINALQQARKENIERLEFTIPGMMALIKRGDWLGSVPFGYTLKGKRVSNSNNLSAIQKIEINEDGKLLKKAWKLKLQGQQDFEIRKEFELYGLKISKQKMSAMWRNPFYCGVSTHKFLEGNPIKGNWSPIINVEDFQKINNAFESNRSGYKQSKFHEGRPLQSHLYCGMCGTKMTGYKAKKTYDYYKCLGKECKCKDMNATTASRGNTGLHDIFKEYLNGFELSSKYESAFKSQMKLTISNIEKDNIQNEKVFTKKKEVLSTKLDNLFDKYIDGDFPKDRYLSKKIEIEQQLLKIDNELFKTAIKISNLDKKIDDCFNSVKNISKHWASGGFSIKNKIQKLVFPDGLVIDSENRQYRTKKINLVFTSIPVISSTNSFKSKNAPSDLDEASCLVAGTGLEPVTFGL